MPSKSTPTESKSALSRREAELELGRKRFAERQKQFGASDTSELIKEGDESRKEDEARMVEAQNRESLETKAERDRAGAEVIDQAQTELEGVQHLADQKETIVSREHENEIEALEGDADPRGARNVTTDIVTAQAVNQPTVLANNEGQDTENKPLNQTGLADESLALDRATIPEDKHTPKTRKQAERVAKGKVPAPQKVVAEGAVVNDPDPSTVVATDIVRSAPDDILGE